jgi:hypothetical protein
MKKVLKNTGKISEVVKVRKGYRKGRKEGTGKG